jgi:hypothetical protein
LKETLTKLTNNSSNRRSRREFIRDTIEILKGEIVQESINKSNFSEKHGPVENIILENPTQENDHDNEDAVALKIDDVAEEQTKTLVSPKTKPISKLDSRNVTF